MLKDTPKCLWCEKPLRPYPYRHGGPRGTLDWVEPDEQWGDYGDNLFCGKTCGFRWGVNVATAAYIVKKK